MNVATSRINQLHQAAMDLAEAAVLAKLRGDLAEHQGLLRQALDAETQAAALLSNQWMAEPTRSVLHRSAASLALQCDERAVAEQLVVTALMGSPPPEVAEELRDLFMRRGNRLTNPSNDRLTESLKRVQVNASIRLS
jgi:hypothetical protein